MAMVEFTKCFGLILCIPVLLLDFIKSAWMQELVKCPDSYQTITFLAAKRFLSLSDHGKKSLHFIFISQTLLVSKETYFIVLY